MDAVALHQPHGARIIVEPDRFRTMGGLSLFEFFGDQIKGCIETRLFPLPLAFGARPDQRLERSVRMMDALGIARHLGADNTCGVAVVGITTNPADTVVRQQFNLKRTG